MELCGGTHVTRTGDIGNVRLVSESGIASGVRRIEALTGEAARLHTARNEVVLRRLGVQFRTGTDELEDKASQLQHRVKELERRVEQLQAQAAGGSDRVVVEIDGVRVIIARHDDLAPRSMRAALDHLRNQVGTGVVVIGGVREGKVTLLAGVTADQVGRLHAGELIRYLAPMVGGKGGGKADMAQGGGPNAARLDEALAAVSDWVKGR
jgi:alanyl-tRNA synthetase